MGIDYVIDLPCPPKAALSIERIVSNIKSRQQASAIVQMLRQRGDQRPPEQMTFTRRVIRPSGPVDEQVSVGDLLNQAKELEPQAHHCVGCKANLLSRPFGCYGSISYPISTRAEEWLMSILPTDLKSPAGHLLRSAVTDFKYDGGMFLNMRPKEMFFESRTPVKRTWGSFLSRWTLTSDQLVHMLFGLGALQPSHCKMMSIILGLIQTGEAETKPPPKADEQSAQLANAINAVGLAGQLGVNLLVDA